QAHVEDRIGLDLRELEGPHQDGLWLVLLTDNLDYLVEVEIGDEITAEHFQAVFNFRQTMPGAAQQHLPPVIEPFAQCFGKAEHLWNAAFHQHIHVEWNTSFELGELEKRLHHEFGVDSTRLWLDHEPDVLS